MVNSYIRKGRRLITESGEQFEQIYELRLNRDGSSSLVPVGKRDIQQEIQSHAKECDMSVILARLATGDTSVLHRTEGMYGDFTGLPSNPAAALQFIYDQQKAFAALPADIRRKFDDDFNRWFCTAGSPSWLDSMGYKRNVDDASGSVSSGSVEPQPIIKEEISK